MLEVIVVFSLHKYYKIVYSIPFKLNTDNV